MKEIIYIQAGELSNYTGTHFWNTQEKYFTYDEIEEPLTSHDVSFTESLSEAGEPTLYPRLLIFDQKANFGTLSKTNAIGLKEDGPLTSWNGEVVEYRQDPIQKSAYQTLIDEPVDDLNVEHSDHRIGVPEVRYWSDYSSVYYLPRTIQKLTDTPEGDWSHGQESFTRYNQDNDLMDGSLRQFIEGCDFLQGIQVSNDTETFGSFFSTFLTGFRDEYRKLPSLVFPILSSSVPMNIDADDYLGTKRVLNDALYLRSVSELSSTNIPIQSPKLWMENVWSGIEAKKDNLYHQSAILSTHVESATLPLRMKGIGEDIASYSAHLNWRISTPFSELSGIFPVTSSSHMGNGLANFSITQPINKKEQTFAQRDVTRGFSALQLEGYERWREELPPLPETFFTRLHAPAYPIPTSFPAFFTPEHLDSGVSAGHPRQLLARPQNSEVLSSLTTTDKTAQTLSGYATFVRGCIRRQSPAVIAASIELDALKDLENDLWSMHDSFRAYGEET